MRGMENMSSRMLEDLVRVVDSYRMHGAPDDFKDEGVRLESDLGHIFITNEDRQIATYNNFTGKLESWYITPYSHYSGFISDLLEMVENKEIVEYDDINYVKEICKSLDLDYEVEWLDEFIGKVIDYDDN